jgi:3-hydroxyisobutyrate dehydrogenase-like beta-hydroxyacid dehydrogenase
MSETRIGFIGLGNMGSRMTQCIVRAGRPVLGYDARRESIELAGASVAASARAVIEGSDIVLLSLPNSAIVLGGDGLAAHARDGQIVVDLSTSSPSSTRRISELLKEKGASYLDAGISGGAAAAEKGELTLMVGGDPDVLERSHDVLGCFATSIFHLGTSGAGHTAKILNNFLNAIALSATSEVMVAAKQAGLDLQVLLDVFNASSGVNFATINHFPKIIRGDYLKGGLTNSLMMKDVTLYAELLGKLGVASLNSAGPFASFGLAIALGYADQISNTVVDAIGDVSGGVRLYEPIEGVHG